jgi:hypothetical protein
MLSKMYLGMEILDEKKKKKTPKTENHLESWTHWIAPNKKSDSGTWKN